ncbi:hypothetical protein [Lactococcus lactis]|uniref:hypothetical protein n=1 Tax=Lactococcus lactis TaxID=1358 RepID=UPI00071C5910|nr:hypothetical protein [Lactococcus lactis]
MIEKYHGYTEKRVKLQGFRPVGKHPFKIIYDAQAVKCDLIQQFEASTGIILPNGVKNTLCTQPVPILGKELAIMKLQLKEKSHEIK